MNNNPKYDSDYVTLGYLKDYINKENPRIYDNKAQTPYSKGSLLSLNGKLYRCIKERSQGAFCIDDWEPVVLDNEEFDKFYEEIYSVDKLLIQEQLDSKIETYYQDTDPSLLWTDDLIKSRHVGDYWFDSRDDSQWIYKKNDTNPITYSWKQISIPDTLYDEINKKKSIYTAKPSSYKKDDLWIISENDTDIPIGDEDNPITVGTWVLALQDSDVYNKEHWSKKDKNVSLEYLEDHHYTKEEISRDYYTKTDVESKITQANDSVMINVSQMYETKEEINTRLLDYDQYINDIHDVLGTTGENITDFIIQNGSIISRVVSNESNYEIIDGKYNEINSKYNEVLEKNDDNKKTIDIISKNIDSETGDIRAVKTVTGFTFDESGLNIHNNETNYNSQTTYTGTYYNDGDELISKTDKDGFLATNIQNKGKYEHGYDVDNDKYLFVDDVITIDGVDVEATFYNGG